MAAKVFYTLLTVDHTKLIEILISVCQTEKPSHRNWSLGGGESLGWMKLV
jgi:hypothetical protein